MGIKFRSVNTDEFGDPSNRNTACAAHSGTINHNCVKRCNGRYIVLFRQFRHKFHHDCRTDGHAQIHRLALDDLLHSGSDQSFLSVRTVVGHNDYFVRKFSNLIFKDNQVFVPGGKDGNYFVARIFHGLNYRKHRGNAHTATGAKDSAEIFDMCCFSQRANQIGNVISRLQLAHLFR